MKQDQNAKNFINLMASFDIPFNPVYYDDLSTMARAVKEQEADAMVAYSSFNSQGLMKSTGIVFSPTQAFVAAGKEGNPELLKTIDSRLAEMKKNTNSFYYDQVEKWFNYEEVVKKPLWLFSSSDYPGNRYDPVIHHHPDSAVEDIEIHERFSGQREGL